MKYGSDKERTSLVGAQIWPDSAALGSFNLFAPLIFGLHPSWMVITLILILMTTTMTIMGPGQGKGVKEFGLSGYITLRIDIVLMMLIMVHISCLVTKESGHVSLVSRY